MAARGPKKKSPAQRRAERTKSLVEGESVDDYRHGDKRKNIPGSGQADYDTAPVERRKYAYDPHLDPQLVWAGKAERTSFEVDTVSLHIHERISTQAILRAAQSRAVQRTLFNDPAEELKPSQRVEFYKHDMGWTNRLILGDSLVVMNSLLEREGMAGKVQMVYIDPPYGVSFNSNFQPAISSREVRDGDDASMTREPEQIQAFRDTWSLGVHSYLDYLRDRILLSHLLLAETGSIFVQIGEENVHYVRVLMDEVFGKQNFLRLISFAKTAGSTAEFLGSTTDYLLWYAKDRNQVKFRQLYHRKVLGSAGTTGYNRVMLPDGTRRRLTDEERLNPEVLPKGARIYTLDNLMSQSIGREKGEGAASWFPVTINGKKYLPNERSRWKTNEAGMESLKAAGRLEPAGDTLRYVRFLNDFPAFPITNSWTDTGIAGFTSDKRYVVETSSKVIERCMLLSTDPGDLVLDPTCGSGTSAYVAEMYGRRWITIDTSRVAVALTRQRILTARYPYYRLQNDELGVRGGFEYERIPHITLKSIAQKGEATDEILFDSPLEEGTKTRVSGPFTAEAIPKFRVPRCLKWVGGSPACQPTGTPS